MSTPIHVLFIEDNPGDARLIQEEFRSTGSKNTVHLEWVDRLEKGLLQLTADPIDAVLLDLSLPDSTGMETLQRVISHVPQTPVVVMTGLADEETAMLAVQSGAQDYLIKGQVDGRILTRSIQYAIQRKRTEEALRESEERFRLVVQSAPNAMVVVDNSGRITLANTAAEELFGYSADELLGQPVELLVPQPFRDAHAHVHQDYLAQPEAIAIGLRGRLSGLHKNGQEIPLEIGLAPYHSSEGLHVLALINDITERKRAEEQVQRQMKQLRALRTIDIAISSSFDLQIVLDVILEQTILQLQVDASAVLLLDPELRTLQFAAGRGFHSAALHHTDLKPGEGYAGRAILSGKTIHISDLMETGGRLASALHVDNESFADYYGTPLIVKGEVKGVLEIYHRSHIKVDSEWLEFLEALAGQAALAIDNAHLFSGLQHAKAELERRVAHRTAQLNQTNLELELANRTKDEFLANMSHELRTPLNSILGLSETLLEERRGSLNEHQRTSLEIVESSGHHLLDMINDILDLSKIEAGKLDYYPQAVNVDELCRSSLAFIQAQAAKKSITVTYANRSEVTRIFADARRLKQVLVNLLTNAVKFTSEKGDVTLRVDTELEQDLIQFSVIDTGIGIAQEDLQKLFQPFVQLDSDLNRKYEGSGLGLALVRRLIDLHGGSIHVESDGVPGRGSRFSVNLSCKQAGMTGAENPDPVLSPDMSAERTGASADALPQRGVILLAEDNLSNVLTIGEYLKSHGYEVIVAHDGLEAMAMAREVGPDLILMDIQMPAMNGLEAMIHLRANPQFATTPIIALTALAMPGDRERCLRAGASEYMSKPVRLKTLRQMIENLLVT